MPSARHYAQVHVKRMNERFFLAGRLQHKNPRRITANITNTNKLCIFVEISILLHCVDGFGAAKRRRS